MAEGTPEVGGTNSGSDPGPTASRSPGEPVPPRSEGPALRRMTPEDVSEVLELERRLFPQDAWPRRFFQDELAQAEPAVPSEKATRRYWVAVVGPEWRDGAESDAREREAARPHDPPESQAAAGRIVGYAGLMCVLPFADVQTLAVAPEAQRTGLGTRLLRTLVREARRRRAEQVLLEVRADNPGAQALYRREGFSHIHTRSMYYPDGEDALIMQKLLTERAGRERR